MGVTRGNYQTLRRYSQEESWLQGRATGGACGCGARLDELAAPVSSLNRSYSKRRCTLTSGDRRLRLKGDCVEMARLTVNVSCNE